MGTKLPTDQTSNEIIRAVEELMLSTVCTRCSGTGSVEHPNSFDTCGLCGGSGRTIKANCIEAHYKRYGCAFYERPDLSFMKDPRAKKEQKST
jgi:hypothetical protein